MEWRAVLIIFVVFVFVVRGWSRAVVHSLEHGVRVNHHRGRGGRLVDGVIEHHDLGKVFVLARFQFQAAIEGRLAAPAAHQAVGDLQGPRRQAEHGLATRAAYVHRCVIPRAER